MRKPKFEWTLLFASNTGYKLWGTQELVPLYCVTDKRGEVLFWTSDRNLAIDRLSDYKE